MVANLIHRNQRGQALVEFILFLPFMLMLYSTVVILGDSIHGSINQQKVTRGYFYFRIQNSPTITRPFRSGGIPIYTNWTNFGMFFIGWSDFLDNEQPVYPCYKLNLPFSSAAGDTCEDTYSNGSGGLPSTQFIRVGTVYGACGATISRSTNAGPGEYVEQPVNGSTADTVLSVISDSSCTISE